VTINIAVKCAEGIVLGADSLNTIIDDRGNIISSIPYVSKLFSLGDSPDKDKAFPVGAMINGANTVGGIRVEDILEEFQEIYSKKNSSDEFSVSKMGDELVAHLQDYIDTNLEKPSEITLELILAGFSKTKQGDRSKRREGYKYGEIYSYFWDNSNTPRVRDVSKKDGEFLTYYGGQPSALDRIRFGIDDWTIYSMLKNKNYLFDQVKKYIYNQLKDKSKFAEEILQVEPPKNMTEYNVFTLLSSGRPGKTVGETIKSIKENMEYRMQTMEGWFSLQTAVDYCMFLMSCAYAQSAFTFVIPVVGSEMRIASITRSEGFKFRRIWEIETPGPPFSLK
jgi:hypothetical protein